MIAQTTLDRPAGELVLDAMAEKHLGAAIIPTDRNGHRDQAFRPFAALAQIVA